MRARGGRCCAAQILRNGAVAADRVVALATGRPLRGDEVTLSASCFGRQVDDEHEAMWTRSSRPSAWPGNRRKEERVEAVAAGSGAGGGALHVVDAQPLDPSRSRANTADTYAWLANSSGWVLPGDAALMITTDIYVPFQHADAVRTLGLPHGIIVDFVGIELGAVDPRLVQSFSACNYLQEIRSTIRSLRMLEPSKLRRPCRPGLLAAAEASLAWASSS